MSNNSDDTFLGGLPSQYSNLLDDIEAAELAEKQRKAAWLARRRGKFTSSEISRLLTTENKPDELPEGAITYATEKAIEILTDGRGKADFTTAEMERGNEKELEAVARFEKEMQVKCYKTGAQQEFVEYCSYFGGTADGLFDKNELIVEDGLIEVKCPNSNTHLFYLQKLNDWTDLKKYKSKYYWQIESNLVVNNRKIGYFISYDDRFIEKKLQIKIVKVPINQPDINFMFNRLKLGENYKQNILKSLKK